MKKQIDPNLNNLSNSNDILNEIETDNNDNNKHKPIDPQLNIDIIDTFNNVDKTVNTQEKEENNIKNINNDNEHLSNNNIEYHHSDHPHSYSDHHSHHSGHHSHSHYNEDEEKEKKKKKKGFIAIFFRILLAIIAIILIISLIAGSTFLILQKKGENDIKESNKVITEDNEYNEVVQYNGKNYVYNSNVITFAFLGIDQNKFKNSSSANYVGSADTDIVVAVNTKNGKVDIIAIPRDTMVDIDVYNNDGDFLRSENKQLCLAYRFANGGEKSSQNVTKAMSRILGVPIDKYFTLDLSGIGPLNDAIGGVTLESKFDFVHDYGLDIHIGDEIKLEGDMAQMYVRARSSDNVNASLGRTERQIQYIKAYAKRLIPAVKEDFSTISKLYDTAQKYSQTNISIENITYIASILLSKNVTDFNTHTLAGTMQPAPVPMKEEEVYAEYILDENAKQELVLNIFYNEVG